MLANVIYSKIPVVGGIYAPFASGVSKHPLDSQNGTLYSAAHGLGSFLTPVDPTSFPSLTRASPRQSSSCSPTPYSASLPLLKPVAPFSEEAPKGCLFAAEWGKDRKDKPNGNLTKKVNSMWNMACEIGGRQGKGGKALLALFWCSTALTLRFRDGPRSPVNGVGRARHGIRCNRRSRYLLGSRVLGVGYLVFMRFCVVLTVVACSHFILKSAGSCILQEAGGFVYSAHPPLEDSADKPLPGADLGSRLYLAIRPCSGTPEETPRQMQDRVAREVWKRVEAMDYQRPT